MKTLYDMLDVHPDDDAGKLKDAFRKAVKVSHPDLNTDDPDASARFNQVVRANAILSDPELRAVYDRMLEFERQQHQPAPAPYNIVPDAIVVVVLAVVMAGAYTLYTNLPALSVHMPKISVTEDKVVADSARESASAAAVQPSPSVEPNNSGGPRDAPDNAEIPAPNPVAPNVFVPNPVAPAANNEVAAESTAPASIAAAASSTADIQASPPADANSSEKPPEALESAEPPAPNPAAPSGAVASATADVQPSPPVDANSSEEPRGTLESDEPPVPNPAAPSAVAPAVHDEVAVEDTAPAGATAPPVTGDAEETKASDAASPGAPLKDARFYRQQGIASYRNGDLRVAIADFDQAIRLDPNFADAYIDRGIALYRMHDFDRAFADVAEAMRLESSHRAAAPPLPRARP